MKALYIRTSNFTTKSVLSLGSYWDCSGRQPVEVAWEYIGEEPELMRALNQLRDDRDAEFMHVINRTI